MACPEGAGSLGVCLSPARAGEVVHKKAAVPAADLAPLAVEPLTELQGAPPLGLFLAGVEAGEASKAFGGHLWQPAARGGPMVAMGFSAGYMTRLIFLAAAAVVATTAVAEAAGILAVGAEVGAPT